MNIESVRDSLDRGIFDKDMYQSPATRQQNQAEIINRMDEAATLAAAEFNKDYVNWSARALALWWAKWYMKAGHKRLGRILLMKSRNP